MGKDAVKTRTVYNLLRERMASGLYFPGYQLLPVRELATSLNVGVVTVRAALNLLEKENRIARKRSQGTFVLNPAVATQDTAAVRKQNRFLAIYAFQRDPVENQMNYIIPSAERHCERLGIQLDKLPRELMPAILSGGGRQLREDRYDAVLAHYRGVRANDPELAFLRSLGIPVLLLRANPGDNETAGVASFYADERGAWRAATEHLAGRGVRRVATIRNQSGDMTENTYRGWGKADYLGLLRELGCSDDPRLIVNADLKDETILDREFDRLETLPHKPDAILCCSDFMAIRVYGQCRQRGIGIPDDLAVMGFCGYPGIRYLDPPLSTIDLGYEEIGRLAVHKLTSAGEWFSPDQQQPAWETPFKVVARASTGRTTTSSEPIRETCGVGKGNLRGGIS